MSAFRRADSFGGDTKVATWPLRIVVNACLDRIRRREEPAADPLSMNEDMTEVRMDAAYAHLWQVDVLDALRQLNPAQRSALVLVDMEGYSIEEAAAILNLPPGMVQSRCARGRAKLARLLRHWQTERNEDESTVDPMTSYPLPRMSLSISRRR